MNRAERRCQSKEDEKLLDNGIKSEQLDNPEPTAAMARQLAVLFERAKKNRSIDRPIGFLQSKVDATLIAQF